MTKYQTVELVTVLLDDDNGVNEKSYEQLLLIMEEYDLGDIRKTVKCTDGRYYLPSE